MNVSVDLSDCGVGNLCFDLVLSIDDAFSSENLW